MRITIDDIRSAAAALAGQVIRTPSIESRVLSELCGTDIVLKLENLQVTGSFKPRGAYIKLMSLSDQERKAGVVAASAGNHAQGVAYHAKRLGIPVSDPHRRCSWRAVQGCGTDRDLWREHH